MFKLLKRVVGQGAQGIESPVAVRSQVVSVDEDIPRYPPFMKGLPSTSPDRLIETQWELIGQIQESGLASKQVFEQYYLEPLRCLASYVHLLPASESHHHRGAGGLFRHAVEVALWSLQLGDRVLLPGDQAPRRRREIEPRWHVAVFLAALCHDIGKPVTDLKVTSEDGEKTWNPFAEDLYSWANANSVDHYFLHWKPNRGRDHTTVSILMAERIISRSTLAWIHCGDPELVLWLVESIGCQPSQTNMIHSLVVRSDQVSVARDMETLGSVFAGYDIGVPVERMLLDIMRRLVREGVWTVNVPGSRLWFMDGYLYLVWPAAGEEMAAVINREKMPGMPRSPNSILDMLAERKLAEVNGAANGEGRYWVIAPGPIAEKIPNIRLTAIRITKPSAVLDPLPPPVFGRLVEEPPKNNSDTEVPASTVSNRLPDPAPPNSAPHQEKLASAASQPPGEYSASKLPGGELGEVIHSIAEDFRTGLKDRKKLTFIDETGVLCLKWPDIIKDRGMDSRSILDGLGSLDLLVVDPMQPFRRVTELRVGIGAPWKVIRVQPILREMLDIKTIAVKKAPPPVIEMSQTPAISTQPSIALEDPAPPKIHHAEDANTQRLLEKKTKLLDEVIALLNQLAINGQVHATNEEGYWLIAVSDSEKPLKDRFKVSRAQILGLQSMNPQRFRTEERERVVYFRVVQVGS